MDAEKKFYCELMKGVLSDSCELEFWDGEIVAIGEGESKFRIILNERLPKSKLLKDPSLVFGESYMFKKMEIVGSPRQVVESIFNNKSSFLNEKNGVFKLAKRIANVIAKNSEDVRYHYDIGNDFYKLWLDETMTYSCAYFKSPADTLEQAQKNKTLHTLKKLDLQPGQTLLDIGCGWGQLLFEAVETYGVKALGITLSTEQYNYVKERIDEKGLEKSAEVMQIDFRRLKGKTFDRVVSVGMLEHLGKENLNDYFSSVYSMLNENGVSLLHCITGRSNEEGKGSDSWINKYIFPGGYIPSIQELVQLIVANGFYLTGVESLRQHYVRTLEHWAANFENALEEISETKDETFIRMWRLYLNSCAASFNCGNIDLHQFLFTKGPVNDFFK